MAPGRWEIDAGRLVRIFNFKTVSNRFKIQLQSKGIAIHFAHITGLGNMKPLEDYCSFFTEIYPFFRFDWVSLIKKIAKSGLVL